MRTTGACISWVSPPGFPFTKPGRDSRTTSFVERGDRRADDQATSPFLLCKLSAEIKVIQPMG